MADAPLRILLQHLHRHRAHAAPGGADDAELLSRFVRARDEAAFELLVWRHGTMVYNVCRRVLRDAHAAEDAFQATFLVLVRRAASVGRGEALAGWLYRVAYRVALRARARVVPVPAADVPDPGAEAPGDVVWRDLRPVLDEEVGRQMHALGTESATAAMADTYEAYRDRLAEFRQRLQYAEGATGLAVAVGGRVVSVDLFDKPSTCRKVWDRLLTGVVLDALEAGPTGEQAGADKVREALAHLRAAAWQQTQPVGVGEEYRWDTDDGRHASALVLGGAVVHGSLVTAG